MCKPFPRTSKPDVNAIDADRAACSARPRLRQRVRLRLRRGAARKGGTPQRGTRGRTGTGGGRRTRPRATARHHPQLPGGRKFARCTHMSAGASAVNAAHRAVAGGLAALTLISGAYFFASVGAGVAYYSGQQKDLQNKAAIAGGGEGKEQ